MQEGCICGIMRLLITKEHSTVARTQLVEMRHKRAVTNEFNESFQRRSDPRNPIADGGLLGCDTHTQSK